MRSTHCGSLSAETYMTRKYWLRQTPSLLVAGAIVLATLLAALTAKSEWLVLTAPALLGASVIGADAWNCQLHGGAFRPSPAALIVGASFLLAGLLLTLRDPSSLKTLIPLIGSIAWSTLLLRPAVRRNPCLGI
jgi:hypothetical protein